MKRAVAAVLLALAALSGMAAPASADERLTIREVDTREFPNVRVSVQVTGETPALSTFTLRENNELLADGGFDVVPISSTDKPIGIVLVVDVSGSMTTNNAIDQAKAAAKQFVSQKLPNDRIAIVAFGNQARVVSGFTSDAAVLNASIDSLVANGETALWDGVRSAVALFGDESKELQPNLILLSDGKDTASLVSEAEARGAALDAKTTVFAIGVKGKDFDPAQVRSLAESTGGLYLEATDPASLGVVYDEVQRTLQNQFEITYTSQATETIDLAVSVKGGQDVVRGVNPGSAARGTTADPVILEPSSSPAIIKNPWLIAGLVLAAAGLLAYALILIFVRDKTSLDWALEPYDEGAYVGPEDASSAGMVLAETAFLKRAVRATEKLARDRGLLERVESQLERADLPLRAGEAIFFWLASVVVLSLLGLGLGGPFGFVLAAFFSALVPLAVLNGIAGQRARKFTSLLPDALQLLAGSLRAGYSLLQGVEAVSQEVSEPMGKELRRVLMEARLGRPIEQSLQDCAERMRSGDFDWAVMAIRIQREVGGNLAELLSTVGETMVSRERLRREIRALTAEGRMSAIVLGILPVGIGLFLWAVNREYMQTLFQDSMGKAMLTGATLLAIVGFYWMKKTIEIEV